AVQATYEGDYDYHSAFGTTAIGAWTDGRTIISGNSQQDVFVNFIQAATPTATPTATVAPSPTPTATATPTPGQITLTASGRKVCHALLLRHGFFAGTGFELLRISDSGVSVAGLPLKMMRFGFWASVSTSSLAYVVTTFRFRRVTWSCFSCSLSCLSVVLMNLSA